MDELVQLLGESPAITLVREKLCQLSARQPAGRRLPAMLIQGETGTGKGLVARIIHRMGPRKAGPFVAINCPAIPETLLEAELFGFERGAFTDAHRAKPGLFQGAHGGTLFLDEVGLLPASVQAKLLTAIEERSVRRLGSTRPEAVDACFISATNIDLQAALREQRFREDLYHRLAVITLDLPPLRDRGRDVLLLAARFLARACADYGLPPKRLDAQAQARLLAYPWPGNIRELANVIERAVLFTESSVVTGEMLGPLPVEGPHPAVSPARAVTVTPEEAMRQHLLSVLEQSEGNISHAATRLGIARNTLYARLEKFGVREHPPHKPPHHRSPESVPAPALTGTRLQWEQRTLTLLRVALSGAEGFDAWPQTSRPLEDAIAKVHIFGGRVEDVTRTGFVAAFGLDPVEDAPRRAAHAAMAIQKSAQRAREGNGGVLEVKIGLHAAPLFIGVVGARTEIDANAKRAQWQVLEQLLQIIDPGGTIASRAAALFLERRFELVPMDAVDEGQGPSYRLTGQERRGFGPWGATTRFVGRRDELEALLSRLAPALDGHGQVVAVVGEPGVGKSRLFHEFTHSHRLHGWLVLESASVSYGQAMSYLPVVNLLKGYFQISDHNTPQDIREKVTGKILALDRALEPTLPALFTLLDCPVDDPRWQSLDPSRRRQRTLDAVKRLLLRESQLQPLLVVMEDLHWIDSETQTLLDVLVESLPLARLLLLISHRPGYEHRWGSRAPYRQVQLGPLSPESALELLDSLLGSHATIEPLKPILTQRTEGNPFFLEESVRDLAETRVLEGERGTYRLAGPLTEVQVPGTVQAILAARIDRLPPEEKRLLQTAAVIGKDVPSPLLQVVADLPDDDLRSGLAHLQTGELLYEKSLFPDPELTFKHALTQEVAYGGLVHESRSALHARIIRAMEVLYADRLDEHVERLAHHAVRGELRDKAVHYLRQAGIKANAVAALPEARIWFEQALGVLESLTRNQSTLEQAFDIRLELRLALGNLGEIRQMLELLHEAEALAEELNDDSRRGRVCAMMTNIHTQLGELDEALVTGTRALEIARHLGDLRLRILATSYLEQAHYFRGEYERVVELATDNLAALPVDWVSEHLGLGAPASVYIRVWLVMSLAELGRFSEAAEAAAEVLNLAEPTRHAYTIGFAHRAAGMLHLVKGDWARARLLIEPWVAAFRLGSLPMLSQAVAAAAWVLTQLDEGSEALERLREGEQLVERLVARRAGANHGWNYYALGSAYLVRGQVEKARSLADRGAKCSTREPGFAAYALLLLGDIATHRDRFDAESGEIYYREALAIAERRGMRPLVAHCYLGLGRLYGRTGKRQEAQEHVTLARTMYREMDMTFWLKAADVEMQG